MFRVKRLAAAIDMIAAGTRAPMAIAPKATPANQLGNWSSNSCGMTSCGLTFPLRPMGLVPALIATYPRSASRRSSREYAGRMAALRRPVLRVLDDSVAVTECGYMNRASADPSASDAYAQYCVAAGTKTPVASLGFAADGVAILACAASKIPVQPPSLAGRYTTATMITM